MSDNEVLIILVNGNREWIIEDPLGRRLNRDDKFVGRSNKRVRPFPDPELAKQKAEQLGLEPKIVQ